jgi:NADPH:quinone reductase-like Zn-dependent oxidoreductase
MLTRKGGPEVLQIVELPLAPPGPGQLRVRVQAAGVGATDVMMLSGNYPFAPKIPFVPGYEAVGVVDAIGPGVSGFNLGQRVAALTVYGGFAEYLFREAEHFLPVADGVSDRDARRNSELHNRIADDSSHRQSAARSMFACNRSQRRSWDSGS